MRALSEDVTFATAWYNLGVVYTELRFMDAATMAFYRSFERERIHPEAFYAIALNFYNTFIEDPEYGTSDSYNWMDNWKKKLNDALFFCEQAELLSKKKIFLGIHSWKISLDFLSIANPEVYLLKGRLNLELFYLTRQIAKYLNGDIADSERNQKREKEASQSHLNKSIEAFQEAVRYSYREWANLDYYRIHDLLAPIDEKNLSLDARIRWDNFRERIAELGWAYMECAANQTDADLKNTLLETSFYIYAQGLSFNPKIIDKKSLEPEHLKRKNYSCPPQISSYSKKFWLQSQEDAGCLLGKNLPSALFLWKYGIISCCLSDFLRSDYFLRKALVQNPRALLFQASHIMVKILKNNNYDPDKINDYWWHTLQQARNAYKADINEKDYQWGYIAESAILISRTQPDFYHKLNRNETTEPTSSQDRNRLTSLIRECDLARSGAFGKYLLSLFSTFEIIDLVLDNDSDFIINIRQKIIDKNKPDRNGSFIQQIIANDILNYIRSEIYKKIESNQTIDKNHVLGYLELHQEWVLGQFYLAFGYLNKNNKKNAEMAQLAFAESRKYLSLYGMELGYRGIYANESYIETNLENFRTALSKAWQSHWKDSTSTFEHMYLGSCQFEIGDYSNAQLSLSDAEFWGLHDIGDITTISINRAAAIVNKTADFPFIPIMQKDGMRNIYLEKALESHKRSLKFAEYEFQKNLSDPYVKNKSKISNTNLNNLLIIHFWMGMIYLNQANYPDAIEQFRVIKNLAHPSEKTLKSGITDIVKKDLERFYISSYYLGKTYLKYGRIADAENEFLILIESIGDAAKRQSNLSVNDDIDCHKILETLYNENFGDTVYIFGLSLKEILFSSYLSLAKIYCLQLCDKEKIVDKIRQATLFINMENFDNPSQLKKWVTLKKEYASEIEKIKGFAYLRSCNNTEKALEHLKIAICIHADPEAYVFLFFTHILRLKTLPDSKKAESVIELNNIYTLLRKIGIPNEYYDEVDSGYKEIIKPSGSSEKQTKTD
jgi:hypothetical protein